MRINFISCGHRFKYHKLAYIKYLQNINKNIDKNKEIIRINRVIHAMREMHDREYGCLTPIFRPGNSYLLDEFIEERKKIK